VIYQVINLVFYGHWNAANLSSTPATAGVYCAHTGLALPNGQVSIDRLLYVGKATNVRERVCGHNKWRVWAQYAIGGRQIWINAAAVADVALRDRAEAALIFYHKPPTNDDLVENFNHQTTTVRTSGQNGLLAGEFTVEASPAWHLLAALAGRPRL
jgi:hypothetical protein